MKKICFLIVALMAIQFAFAYQVDVIVTTSRMQIPCLYLSHDANVVVYHSSDTTDTKQYTIAIEDVELIYLHSGDVLVHTQDSRHSLEKESTTADRQETTQVTGTAPQPQSSHPTVSPRGTTTTTTTTTSVSTTKTTTASKESRAQSEQQFQHAIGQIYGKIPEDDTHKPAQGETRTKTDDRTYILLFLVGMGDSLSTARQIIEDELITKFNSLDGYQAQKCDSAVEKYSEDQMIDIAKNANSAYATIIKFVPFQNEYYMQAKLIDASTGRPIASSSGSMTLDNVGTILNTTNEVAAQLSEPLKIKRAEEVAQNERREEAEETVKEILRQQEREEQIHNERQGGIFGLFSTEEEEVYFLVIDNLKKYACRVIVAGREIGVVNPNRAQKFVVPTYLFGRVQIVQVTGNKGRQSEKVFIIPKQNSLATVTLDNED